MTSRIVLETKYGKIIRATPQANGTTLFCRLPYTKKPSPMEPNSNPQSRDDVSKKRLTVKLRGRPEAPTKRRGRTLSSRARGADPLDVHGPLQRLLGADILVDLSEYVTAGHKSPKSTVVTVIAVVAHHEERVSWHANP